MCLLFNASNNNVKSSSSLQLVLLTRITGRSFRYSIVFFSSFSRVNRDESVELHNSNRSLLSNLSFPHTFLEIVYTHISPSFSVESDVFPPSKEYEINSLVYHKAQMLSKKQTVLLKSSRKKNLLLNHMNSQILRKCIGYTQVYIR